MLIGRRQSRHTGATSARCTASVGCVEVRASSHRRSRRCGRVGCPCRAGIQPSASSRPRGSVTPQGRRSSRPRRSAALPSSTHSRRCVLGTPSACSDRGLHAVGRVGRVIALPDHDDFPTCISQALHRIGVSCLVSSDLRGPVIEVLCATVHRLVVLVSVPIAAAYIDGDLGCSEDDVDPSFGAWNDRSVKAKPQAASVEDPPEYDFRCCVAASLRAHPHADAGTTCPALGSGGRRLSRGLGVRCAC